MIWIAFILGLAVATAIALHRDTNNRRERVLMLLTDGRWWSANDVAQALAPDLDEDAARVMLLELEAGNLVRSQLLPGSQMHLRQPG